MPSLDLNYYPTPKQAEFHQSHARFRMMIGGAGSGKSMGLLMESIQNYNCRFAGCHTLLLRKDFAELNKGLIQDLQDKVPNPDQQLFKYNASSHVATFFNGSKLYFGHCENLSIKDLNQYLSAAFSFIGVEEAGEFPFNIWNWLIQRNRNRVAGPIPSQAGVTNPYGIGYGWIKRMFVEKQPVADIDVKTYEPKDYFFNHSTLLDNPHLTAADPDYINRLNLLAPALRQKMLYGDLNSVAGQYFTNFDPGRHLIKAADMPKRIQWEDWQVPWLGSDWGLAHFWVTYWLRLAMVETDGLWKRKCVVYKELCEREKSITEYAQLVAEKNRGEKLAYCFFSPERFNRIDPQHTPADQFTAAMRGYGLPSATRASNERIAGATFLYSLLDSDSLCIIEEACPNLVRTIPTLIRDPDDIEDIQKADTMEDDCYDSFRYGVVSLLHPKAKPPEVEIAEQASKIQDPIAKHFFVVRATQQMEERNTGHKPVVIPSWQRELR